MDTEAIVRLRSTSKEMMSDPLLLEAHQKIQSLKEALYTGVGYDLRKSRLRDENFWLNCFLRFSPEDGEERKEAYDLERRELRLINDHIENSTHQYLQSLEEFKEKLKNTFYVKSVREIEEIGISIKKDLNREHRKLKSKSKSKTFSSIDAIKCRIIEIKLRMLEGEIFIVNYNQELNDHFEYGNYINEIRSQKVIDSFYRFPENLWESFHLKIFHSLELVAALFSSMPEQMLVYLNDQHENDLYMQYKCMKSADYFKWYDSPLAKQLGEEFKIKINMDTPCTLL